MLHRLSVLLVLTLLMTACTALAPVRPDAPFFPATFPDANAPVTVRLISPEQFTVANHTAAPIYTQIFPTDLLPLIDWAPCATIAECAPNAIQPGSSRTFDLATIGDRDTASITVFWWQMAGDVGGPEEGYFFPQGIDFPIH